MSGWRRTAACERAARLISLELDGEIGRRDRAVLDRHLGRCPDCARLKSSMGTFTTILRLTPPERTSAPIAVPERASAHPARRARALVTILAVGAFAAVAATLFTVPQGNQKSDVGQVALAQQARLFNAELLPPQDQEPLTDDLTTTPLPAQPMPACSLGCWPQSSV